MKMTKNMSLGLALVGASVLAGLGTPSVSHAVAPACVTKLMTDIEASIATGCTVAPGKLVLHRKNDRWVSYTPLNFGFDANGAVSKKSKQTFSDRCVNTDSCIRLGTWQNFAIDKADSHTIQINKTTGTITIVNHTWNFTTTLQATCDGNVIKATDGSFLYTISHSRFSCAII